MFIIWEHELKNTFWSVALSKTKVDKEEKLIPCTKKIFELLVQPMVIINATLFFHRGLWIIFYLDNITPGGCNEIESKIANCKMSRGEKTMKKKMKIKTQNEDGRDR